MSTSKGRHPFRDAPTSIATKSSAANLTGTWRYARPIFLKRLGPCSVACPANERIDEVMFLAGEDRFAEAYKRIRKDNPLPATCGRVCLRFCEAECHRRSFDEAVSIRDVERAIADQARRKGVVPDATLPATGRNVAVVGSGPAGLSTAYFSAMLGHRVTLFEAEASAGGMLRWAIPEYRLPRDVLEWEIDQILSLGIEFRGGTRVGRDVSTEELARFGAVFLAPGAGVDSHVSGIESTVTGVHGALEFLKGDGKAGGLHLSGSVVVIGGGNTAIDAARVALRRGGDPTVLYRRSRLEMPAAEEEIRQAEREGITFRHMAGVTGIVKGPQGEVKALLCVRMSLGKDDGSGRRSFHAIEGSSFEIKADHVVIAGGQRTDLSFLPAIKKKEDGLIEVTPAMATSLGGVFAGGDAIDQPRTVVHAIASGKKAAFSIDLFLKGRLDDIPGPELAAVPYEELHIESFPRSRRPRPAMIPVREAREGFLEVEKGLSQREAVRSARRCFNCGICSFCDRCDSFCPDLSIRLDKSSAERSIDYDHCKGCGICVTECPRGAIGWEKEK